MVLGGLQFLHACTNSIIKLGIEIEKVSPNLNYRQLCNKYDPKKRSSFRVSDFRSAYSFQRSLPQMHRAPLPITFYVPVPVPHTATIRVPGNPGLHGEG